MSRQSPAALRPGNMRPSLPLSVLATSVTSAAALVSYTPPSCSLDGLKIGAGLGSVAGAVGGVAATSGLASGAATLATCPSLMISTLGHGLVNITHNHKILEFVPSFKKITTKILFSSLPCTVFVT